MFVAEGWKHRLNVNWSNWQKAGNIYFNLFFTSQAFPRNPELAVAATIESSLLHTQLVASKI
jgi:hypothetical protein